MQTSVIGFPRIGTLRELKFASEKYFRGEISSQELLDTAKNLRKIHWTIQKNEGIDFIPSNDFSFYDTLLDTAAALGIVPRRYKELNLSGLDTYFAMARGYQGESGDVKALAMKKWFNTNYHYIVPEVEDDTVIRLSADKLLNEYKEAKELGITTKPVIAGPYTVLKLCRFTENKGIDDFLDDFIAAYKELIALCNDNNISWLQLDEPALVYDLSDADKALFNKIYDELLKERGNCNILLQTYFGDVRDIYEDIINKPFAGVGLDFNEGRKTFELVEKYGFPAGKLLFAGVVNGKNIWKNNYKKTLDLISSIKNACDNNINVVISTSCSLLHVPYTLKHEDKLADSYKIHFSFAEEKLTELAELGVLADKKQDKVKSENAYIDNQKVFEEERNCNNAEVKERLANIKEEDYVRLPLRSERQKLQKEKLGLPEFPTTTIGSFPQTKEIKAERAAYRKNEISEEEYTQYIKKQIADCVKWQEEIGLDVLVHGEYERNDMVEYFGEALEGYLFTQKAWVQSYGTRCVKPPVIWGDVYRKKPMTVDWSVYAQSLTNKPMKGMLTGPVTILNWSFPREDITIKESILQIALAIRDEVLDLEAAGIKVIQIDEAALREKLPLRKSDWYKEYLDFAIPAFRLTHSGVKKDTQIHTHMCYSEFTDIIPAIDDMDADVITFEASRSDLLILDSLRENNFETEVGPGVYDIHSPRVPSVDEIVNALNIMLTKISSDKLWVNPDCGLKTRGVKETDASLRNMVEAAKIIRNR
jgi:5-methyltetrahydropteroyltriglutamate--homocysteine methyltransferase